MTRTLKRYGPFAAVAVVVVAAIAVFGGGDDAPDDDTDTASLDEEELIRSGPMTPARAELEGRDAVDFGEGCDQDTGRIKLPTIYAPPCVEPFDGDSDNGGDTSQGVTGDEILLVRYDTDPAIDPLYAAQLGAAGADLDPDKIQQTVQGFVDVFEQTFETYGRRVRVVPFIGTGPGDDAAAAKADAISIAEMEPFAVVGGPTRMGPVFASELAARGVLCIGVCALAVPESTTRENQPYIWPYQATPNQGAALAAELIGKLAGPGKAELAGDADMRAKDRVYALLHYDNPDGDHQEVFESLRDELAAYDIELATHAPFDLDFGRMQDNARTIIAQLENAGVTTVIYYGDPVTPSALTEEATAQDFWPEWILGPSVLADTALFAREFDQEQWVNGFGIGLTPARGEEETGDWYRIYDWAYGTRPPSNIYNALAPSLMTLFVGIHLAGPELTPETFRDGMFRYPPSGGGPTSLQISRGDHGVWPDLDLGGSDDAAIIWWDPEAEGVDEAGNEGIGLYRYANDGERYTLGELPESVEEARLFDEGASVTIYDELPPDDHTPDYPSPDL